MAISIQKLTLWTTDIGNRPGSLGALLGPLADAGCDLEVLMAYVKPGDPAKGVVELAPISGARATRAAKSAGLAPAAIPCLLVDGDNRQGLGHAIASALGAAGINLHFVVTLVSGKRYRAVFGFGAETQPAAVTRVIRSAVAAAAAARKPKRKGR